MHLLLYRGVVYNKLYTHCCFKPTPLQHDGVANTGSGGDGGAYNYSTSQTNNSGAGSSGIVIIRFKNINFNLYLIGLHNWNNKIRNNFDPVILFLILKVHYIYY